MPSLIDILSEARIDYRESGKNVGTDMINICCPFCGESKFHCGIHFRDLWHHCFVCGTGGGWGKISKVLREHAPQANWGALRNQQQSFYLDDAREKPETSDLPQYWRAVTDDDQPIVDWLISSPHPEAIKDKFRERQLPLELANDSGLMIGIGKLAGYVVFNTNGNIIARKFHNEVRGPTYWRRTADNPYLFGADWVKRVSPDTGYVTEGIFDCMRIPIGYGVAILGSAVSEVLINEIAETFKDATNIILALDRDANRDSIMSMRLLLTDVGFNVSTLDWGSIPNPDIKDIDELYITQGADAVLDLIRFPHRNNFSLL